MNLEFFHVGPMASCLQHCLDSSWHSCEGSVERKCLGKVMTSHFWPHQYCAFMPYEGRSQWRGSNLEKCPHLMLGVSMRYEWAMIWPVGVKKWHDCSASWWCFPWSIVIIIMTWFIILLTISLYCFNCFWWSVLMLLTPLLKYRNTIYRRTLAQW